MEELGILSQPFISSFDIMFLCAAGWSSKELADFPPDVIRSLIKSELKKEATIEKFRGVIGLAKTRTLATALQLCEA